MSSEWPEYTVQFVTSSVITLTICVFGLIGNALCGVVLFSKHMGHSSYVYLLQGLTISDSCLLVLSFFRTLHNLQVIHISNDVYTGTIIFFWDWISTSSTKYFTVVVSIERFFCITFPLKAHTLMTKKRSRMVALGVLLFCVVLSSFSFIYDNWIDKDSFPIYVAIVLHFLPFLLVVIFNVLIFIGLRKISQQSIRKNSTHKQRDEEDYNVTKMLFTIVLVFGLCYSFEFIRRLMNYLAKDYMSRYNYYDYTINCLADIFYVLNSSVNFVIYCLLGKRFRTVFFKIFTLPSVLRRKSFIIGGANKSGGMGDNVKEGKVNNSYSDTDTTNSGTSEI